MPDSNNPNGGNASTAANAASPATLTGAQRLDLIGSALQDFGHSLAGASPDMAALGAWQRQFQQDQDAFAQRIGFRRMPGPYQSVMPVTLNPPAAAAKPGDLAISAMAKLYR